MHKKIFLLFLFCVVGYFTFKLLKKQTSILHKAIKGNEPIKVEIIIQNIWTMQLQNYLNTDAIRRVYTHNSN